uniref:Uncharacterized protein n=1 Tax=Chromera velia CCMP2878 TaxID=1169474 RepID=A0A0G4HBE0_9ALVE|eukprot:Cvel_922.t1-p1 / transcript=Cvel_922.t1 / gene=Cvel_922 / organism=Chromera_velia_CCMP2878 / gene_product=hypothetical protein / transcript_product=hypothetical protein / location=Cvel_scaffold29:80763-87679(-) / protein_length=619 / sequence_SO=supercontig / SO=protein_coding / is_pseudo=false
MDSNGKPASWVEFPGEMCETTTQQEMEQFMAENDCVVVGNEAVNRAFESWAKVPQPKLLLKYEGIWRKLDKEAEQKFKDMVEMEAFDDDDDAFGEDELWGDGDLLGAIPGPMGSLGPFEESYRSGQEGALTGAIDDAFKDSMKQEDKEEEEEEEENPKEETKEPAEEDKGDETEEETTPPKKPMDKGDVTGGEGDLTGMAPLGPDGKPLPPKDTTPKTDTTGDDDKGTGDKGPGKKTTNPEDDGTGTTKPPKPPTTGDDDKGDTEEEKEKDGKTKKPVSPSPSTPKTDTTEDDKGGDKGPEKKPTGPDVPGGDGDLLGAAPLGPDGKPLPPKDTTTGDKGKNEDLGLEDGKPKKPVSPSPSTPGADKPKGDDKGKDKDTPGDKKGPKGPNTGGKKPPTGPSKKPSGPANPPNTGGHTKPPTGKKPVSPYEQKPPPFKPSNPTGPNSTKKPSTNKPVSKHDHSKKPGGTKENKDQPKPSPNQPTVFYDPKKNKPLKQMDKKEKDDVIEGELAAIVTEAIDKEKRRLSEENIQADFHNLHIPIHSRVGKPVRLLGVWVRRLREGERYFRVKRKTTLHWWYGYAIKKVQSGGWKKEWGQSTGRTRASQRPSQKPSKRAAWKN